MIQLSLNNEPAQLAEGTRLSDALSDWHYGDQKIAVAINGEFVPRSAYAERVLHAGDEVDVVKPIGGG
jgi:sulfur carrier protein